MQKVLRKLTLYCVLITAAAFAGTAQARESGYVVQLKPAVSTLDTREQLNSMLGRELKISREFVQIFNGFATHMDDSEAQQLRRHANVVAVIKDQPLEVLIPKAIPRQPGNNPDSSEQSTGGSGSGDPVVDLVRANEVWDGSATNDAGHLGEGVVIGFTGTGISGGHPAFAATGDDGYTHTNPLGDGVYLGECFDTPDLVCNSKLIGRYSFVDDPLISSEEPDGSGNSAVAQAAGNRLTGDSVGDIGLPLVTGVAPHANVIVYRTCITTCSSVSVLIAFEQAINDDVDILVHYIGSDTNSPWNSLFALAAQALRSNDISLAYITGSSGPEPGTLDLALAAPWVATFISSTHGRSNYFKMLTRFSGGDTAPPGDLIGGSLGGMTTANIVYAGNLNSVIPDAAMCNEPFPPDTLNGEILVCDRGQIPRVQKAINAMDSGAGGMVLANVTGGADSINADFFPIPGIHLNAADSEVLRVWLSSGSDHAASIILVDAPVDPELADKLFAGSSRGPLQGLDYLVPSAAAPSVDVVIPTGANGFRVGRGPASGPGGGALALLKSARPDWTAAELLSALMTTGIAPMAEQFDDSITTPFDHGGGRIDVAAASQAGLLLNETQAGFLAANPDQGGDPSRMNLPGLIDLNCLEICQWSRTVKAVAPASWNAVVATGGEGAITVIPESFSLEAGELQSVDILFSAEGTAEGVYHGSVLLVPDVPGLSPTRLTLSVDVQADMDLDGVANSADNCLNLSNADQRDSDADGFGNRCDTDLNNDGVTNFADVTLFVERFQSSDEEADFSGDGVVDVQDLDVVRGYFLQPPGPSGLF